MSDVLDNPVWHTLTTHHAALAVGAGGARRYREDVSVFWGAEALDDAGWAALAELGGPGAGVVLAATACRTRRRAGRFSGAARDTR